MFNYALKMIGSAFDGRYSLCSGSKSFRFMMAIKQLRDSEEFLKEQCVFQQQKTKYGQNVLSSVSFYTRA